MLLLILTALLVFDSVSYSEASVQCIDCVYSSNSGCDITADLLKVGQNQLTCDYGCSTLIERSTGASTYEITRGCSDEPVCTEYSYSVSDSFTVRTCCATGLCNTDISSALFECFACADTDDGSSNVTCPEKSFWDKTSSRLTVHCASFCEKRVRTQNGATYVTRSCQDSCEETSYSRNDVKTQTFCCNNLDICNGCARTWAAAATTLTLAVLGAWLFDI